MRRLTLIAGAILALALGLGLIFGLGLTQSAGAGIGPAGFAFYARQGIVRENNSIYGTGNSPWRVSCVDHPSYVYPPSDRVVCVITLKHP